VGRGGRRPRRGSPSLVRRRRRGGARAGEAPRRGRAARPRGRPAAGAASRERRHGDGRAGGVPEARVEPARGGARQEAGMAEGALDPPHASGGSRPPGAPARRREARREGARRRRGDGVGARARRPGGLDRREVAPGRAREHVPPRASSARAPNPAAPRRARAGHEPARPVRERTARAEPPDEKPCAATPPRTSHVGGRNEDGGASPRSREDGKRREPGPPRPRGGDLHSSTGPPRRAACEAGGGKASGARERRKGSATRTPRARLSPQRGAATGPEPAARRFDPGQRSRLRRATPEAGLLEGGLHGFENRRHASARSPITTISQADAQRKSATEMANASRTAGRVWRGARGRPRAGSRAPGSGGRSGMTDPRVRDGVGEVREEGAANVSAETVVVARTRRRASSPS
jgi:hypothetical protein